MPPRTPIVLIVSPSSLRRDSRNAAPVGSTVLHPPCRAVAAGLGRSEQVEERHGVEGLRATHPRPLPYPGGEKLKCHGRIDRGLPHHTLGAVLTHRPLVVDHVVEVDLAGRAALAGAGHPETGAGLAGHPWADRGRIGQACLLYTSPSPRDGL